VLRKRDASILPRYLGFKTKAFLKTLVPIKKSPIIPILPKKLRKKFLPLIKEVNKLIITRKTKFLKVKNSNSFPPF